MGKGGGEVQSVDIAHSTQAPFDKTRKTAMDGEVEA